MLVTQAIHVNQFKTFDLVMLSWQALFEIYIPLNQTIQPIPFNTAAGKQCAAVHFNLSAEK